MTCGMGLHLFPCKWTSTSVYQRNWVWVSMLSTLNIIFTNFTKCSPGCELPEGTLILHLLMCCFFVSHCSTWTLLILALHHTRLRRPCFGKSVYDFRVTSKISTLYALSFLLVSHPLKTSQIYFLWHFCTMCVHVVVKV